MNKPVIISGEASETDSENEINVETIPVTTQIIQGEIISGEDSESECENDFNVISATSVFNDLSVHEKPECENYNSLFHHKLRESNIQLKDNLEAFVQNTIQEAGKNLNATEQHLLKSQLTLQNAVTSLKSLSVNSLSIKSKLHSFLTTKFLSNVNIDTLNNIKK